MKKLLVIVLFLSAAAISLAQAPRIRNVQSDVGYPGEVISIQGTNLGANTQVTFGGVAGNVVSRSDQLMEVEVPPGALFDYISVLNTSNRLESRARMPFTMSYGGSPGLTSADFATQANFFSESELFDLCLCDLDGDGLNDVAASNQNSEFGTIFLNSSTIGSLNLTKSTLPVRDFDANTFYISCDDLNGDQRPEIIFTEFNDGNRLFILINNSSPGNLNFSREDYTIPDNSRSGVVVHDLDGDGKPEIIVADASNPRVSIIKNNSTAGTLNLSATTVDVTLPGATNVDNVIVGDFNSDGKDDLACFEILNSNADLYISLNQSTSGNINFNTFSSIDAGGAKTDLKAADLNGDDRLDLIYTDFLNSSLFVVPNLTAQGSASLNFGSPINISSLPGMRGLDLADFDGDGQVDIIVGSQGSNAVGLLRNTSAGTNISFSPITIPVSATNRKVAAGDLDGDGKPDIAIADQDDNIAILRNLKCAVPNIAPAGPLNLCAGNTETLRVQKLPGANYNWQVDGATEKNGPEPFFDITTLSGNYTVTINQGTCSEPSSAVSVSVAPGPGTYNSPNFTSPAGPVCIGGTLSLALQNLANSGDTFEWRGPEGYTSSGNPATAINNFRFINSGLYEVDIFASGCLIETKSIRVEAVPSPDLVVNSSAAGAVCEGDPVTLSVTPQPNFDYAWIDGNGDVVSSNASFSVTTSGTYFVRASDQVNTTCPDIDSDPVTVQILSAPVVDFDSPPISCVNSPVSPVDNSTLASAATPQYLWDFGDGTVSGSPNPVHSYAAPGDYTISLTVGYQGLTCQNTATQGITVQPSLEIELVANPSVICEGITAEISTVQDFEGYQWSGGEATPTLVVSESGTYTLTATDANGCSGLASINIGAFPNPVVEVSADPTRVAPGRPVQLNASGLQSYSWEPAELLDDPNSATPIATVNQPTTFQVTGTDDNGCQGTATIEIIVEGNLIGELLDPKNFFSPNPDDNINATWVIDGILEFPQCEVTIYDQTGNMLYQARPYLNEWDGTTGGKDVPNGVYYFTVNCGGGLAKTGSITILR